MPEQGSGQQKYKPNLQSPVNRSTIRDLIAQSQLSEAIEAMKQLAAGTRHANDIVLQAARLNSIEQDNRRGLLSPGESDRARNQITHALLQLLDDLPDGSTLTVSVTKPPAGSGGTGSATPPPVPTGTGDGGPAAGDSGTRDGGTSHKISVWIGVASLAAILAAVLLVPCPSSAQFFVFRLILALGAAGIGSILPGFLNIESGAAKAGGALGLFALVYLLNPATLIGDERCNQKPFTLTVSVRAKKPSPDYPDLKNAELWLWQENDWRKSPVSPEGIADFKNLAPELVGKRTAIQWRGLHFRPASDSLTIQPPAAVLELGPDGSLERVFGKITDPRGQGLAGVIVEVESQFYTTDTNGNYELRIPPAQQRDHYLLRASKKGLAACRKEVWPASGRLDFSMKK